MSSSIAKKRAADEARLQRSRQQQAEREAEAARTAVPPRDLHPLESTVDRKFRAIAYAKLVFERNKTLTYQ